MICCSLSHSIRRSSRSSSPRHGGTVPRRQRSSGGARADDHRDAISIVLAKGHVTDAEATQMVAFATALGCTLDEVRAMSEHLAPWLSVL